MEEPKEEHFAFDEDTLPNSANSDKIRNYPSVDESSNRAKQNEEVCSAQDEVERGLQLQQTVSASSKNTLAARDVPDVCMSNAPSVSGLMSDGGDGFSDVEKKSTGSSSYRLSSPNPSEFDEITNLAPGGGVEKRKLKKRRSDGETAGIHTTPKAATSSASRLAYPLSERQQLALLMQMTAVDTNSPGGDSPKSPASSTPGRGKVSKVHRRNERGETHLHIAARKGDYKLCRSLIRDGADVNAIDYAGWSPLHEACNHGWYKTAKTLIKNGADVNASGLDQDRPLHDAASNGQVKLVVLLLKHGAKRDNMNAKGEKAIDLAETDEVRRLLKASSPPSLLDESPSSSASSPTSVSISSEHSLKSVPHTISTQSQNLVQPAEKEKMEPIGQTQLSIPTPRNTKSPSSSIPVPTPVPKGTPQEGTSFKSLLKPSPSTHQLKSHLPQPERVKKSKSEIPASENSASTPKSDSNEKPQAVTVNRATDIGMLPWLKSETLSKGPDKPSSSQGGLLKVSPESKIKQGSGSGSRSHQQLHSKKHHSASQKPDSALLSAKASKLAKKLQGSSSTATAGGESKQSSMVTPKSSKVEAGGSSSGSGGGSQRSSSSKSSKKRKFGDVFDFHGSDSDDDAVSTKKGIAPSGTNAAPSKVGVSSRITTEGKKSGGAGGHSPGGKTTVGGGGKSPGSSSSVSNTQEKAKVEEGMVREKILQLKPPRSGMVLPKIPRISDKKTSSAAPGAAPGAKGSLKLVESDSQPGRQSSDDSLSVKATVGGAGMITETDELTKEKSTPVNSELSGEQTSTRKRTLTQTDDVEEVKASESIPSLVKSGDNIEGGQSVTSLKTTPLLIDERSGQQKTEEDSSDPPQNVPQPAKVAARAVELSVASTSVDFSPELNAFPGELPPLLPPPPIEEPPVQIKKVDLSKTNFPPIELPSEASGSRRISKAPSGGRKTPEICPLHISASTPAFSASMMSSGPAHLKKRKVQMVSGSKAIRTGTPDPSAPGSDPSGSGDKKREGSGGTEEQSIAARVFCGKNSFESYRELRTMIEKRWNLISYPKGLVYYRPSNIHNFLHYKKAYLIEANRDQMLQAKMNPEPDELPEEMKECFRRQETERQRLREQHQVERERLCMMCEKEILRVYNRCSRIAGGELEPPLSCIRILRDAEIYNPLELEKPIETDIIAKERFESNDVQNWVDEIFERFSRRKVHLLKRQKMESDSLYAAQRMDWDLKWRVWKHEQHCPIEGKEKPQANFLPQVKVLEDFALLPSST